VRVDMSACWFARTDDFSALPYPPFALECGSLKDGKNRPLRPDGAECQCSEGWTGLNCNGSQLLRTRAKLSSSPNLVCKDDNACSGFPIGSGMSRPMRHADGGLSSSLKQDERRNMTCYRNGPTVNNNHYMCDVTSGLIICLCSFLSH